MTLNANSTVDVRGIATYGDYTGVNKACVQSLIDLIEPFHTQDQRGHLDQISPQARIQLLAELEALYTAVDNV